MAEKGRLPCTCSVQFKDFMQLDGSRDTPFTSNQSCASGRTASLDFQRAVIMETPRSSPQTYHIILPPTRRRDKLFSDSDHAIYLPKGLRPLLKFKPRNKVGRLNEKRAPSLQLARICEIWWHFFVGEWFQYVHSLWQGPERIYLFSPFWASNQAYQSILVAERLIHQGSPSIVWVGRLRPSRAHLFAYCANQSSPGFQHDHAIPAPGPLGPAQLSPVLSSLSHRFHPFTSSPNILHVLGLTYSLTVATHTRLEIDLLTYPAPRAILPRPEYTESQWAPRRRCFPGKSTSGWMGCMYRIFVLLLMNVLFSAQNARKSLYFLLWISCPCD